MKPKLNIRKIKNNIWPSRKFYNWNWWNNRRNQLKFPIGKIMPLITTYSTLSARIIEYIKNRLPRIGNCLNKNIELYPFSESNPIILEPSACELCYCIHITENLWHVSLFPGYIFLELIWKFLIFSDTLKILINTTHKPRGIEWCFGIGTLRDCFIYTKIPKSTIDLFLISLKSTSIFIQLWWKNPWYIDRNFLGFNSNKWKLSDELVRCLHRTESTSNRIDCWSIVGNEVLLNRTKRFPKGWICPS